MCQQMPSIWSKRGLRFHVAIQLTLYRSSHRRCSKRKGVLRNFATYTGKYLCQSLFSCSLRPATLLEKRLWHSCFPVNFAKFLRTPVLQNTSRRLLLSLLLVQIMISFCSQQQKFDEVFDDINVLSQQLTQSSLSRLSKHVIWPQSASLHKVPYVRFFWLA